MRSCYLEARCCGKVTERKDDEFAPSNTLRGQSSKQSSRRAGNYSLTHCLAWSSMSLLSGCLSASDRHLSSRYHHCSYLTLIYTHTHSLSLYIIMTRTFFGESIALGEFPSSRLISLFVLSFEVGGNWKVRRFIALRRSLKGGADYLPQMNGTLESGKKLVKALQEAKLDANTGECGGPISLSSVTDCKCLLFVEVVIAPPSLHLLLVKDMLANTPKIEVAGQNAYHEPSGAFTGEVSVSQLQDAGVPWVILGHSERRTIFKEDNKEIAVKTKAALDHNLKVIICVGETLEEREKDESVSVVVGQLSAVENSVEDWS